MRRYWAERWGLASGQAELLERQHGSAVEHRICLVALFIEEFLNLF